MTIEVIFPSYFFTLPRRNSTVLETKRVLREKFVANLKANELVVKTESGIILSFLHLPTVTNDHYIF